MKLNTVNVICTNEGSISSISSFDDTLDGNFEAESLFKELIKQDDKETDCDLYLDDGVYVNCAFAVYLVHSS